MVRVVIGMKMRWNRTGNGGRIEIGVVESMMISALMRNGGGGGWRRGGSEGRG